MLQEYFDTDNISKVCMMRSSFRFISQQLRNLISSPPQTLSYHSLTHINININDIIMLAWIQRDFYATSLFLYLESFDDNNAAQAGLFVLSKTINDVVRLVSGSSLHTSADNYSHQLGITWISVQSSKLFLSRAKPHVSKFSKWQVVVKAGLVD